MKKPGDGESHVRGSSGPLRVLPAQVCTDHRGGGGRERHAG